LGLDTIFHLRRGISEATFQQVEDEALRLLRKVVERRGKIE
jgi:hypothetical protein